jgi:cytochrome bd-type quinol oxidase subunit 1
MEGLEQLVKLASFGTAGVCVLAIFIIGISIFKLPNNTSKEKVSLIKTYMNMCIIIAVICTVSGTANAYFNLNKINEANENFAQMTSAYENETKKVDAEKTELNSTINLLRDQLQHGNQLSPSVSLTLRNTEQKIRNIQLTPKNRILEDVKARRFNPPRP